MKVVLAPNAFKGSALATEAAGAMARGVKRVLPDCIAVEVPVADGGDGLHEVARQMLDGEDVPVAVTGPRFKTVESGFVAARSRDLAVIEMARASGLAMLGGLDLDPTVTTTQGTGELMRAALDAGLRHLVIGIGGSATTDGGVGMATALGWRFLDEAGEVVKPTGGELSRITTIDGSGVDPRLAEARVEVACDVDNPLCGERGAAAVYGPQKGATPGQVEELDQGLAHLADIVAAAAGGDFRDLPGAGAAGGLGFGLRAFAGGELRRGTEVIFAWVGLEEALVAADLVITGEGQIDHQTRMGKAPAAVGERAQAHGIPCLALAGSVGKRIDELRDCGIEAVFSICPGPRTRDQVMARTISYLEGATEQVMRAFVAGRRSGM